MFPCVDAQIPLKERALPQNELVTGHRRRVRGKKDKEEGGRIGKGRYTRRKSESGDAGVVEGRFKLVRVRNREEEVEDGERGREETRWRGKTEGKSGVKIECTAVM